MLEDTGIYGNMAMTYEESDARRIRTASAIMKVSLEEAERRLDEVHGPGWRLTYRRQHGLLPSESELAARRAAASDVSPKWQEDYSRLHIDELIKRWLYDFDIGGEEPEEPPPYVPNDPPDAVDKDLAMVEEQESKRQAETAKPTPSEIGDSSDD
ncbi:hypothetical protein DES53_115155 [Roseimicrobium gellanilyticum]|uniref:Uncharacterized protein n=1 Tax=Roseimicrobium gellanilyticum TaxID=748857 RepID=A0A366H4S4_9BACT|nr:hypothetical protein [Roseimicrobium gellanilyticum]RBP37014.1 hypothetical protein DES53_115155 [Roseimicrobium gellanilyticum]